MDNNVETKDFSPLKFRGLNYIGEWFKDQYQYWNEDLQKWVHNWTFEYLDRTPRDFFEFDNDRKNGVFMILDCVDASDATTIKDVLKASDMRCLPFIDKYCAVGPHWEGPDWVNPIFRPGGFGEKFGGSMNNKNYNFIFQDEHIIFDGRPYFYIGYTNLVDLNKKIEGLPPVESVLFGYEISDELEDIYIKQHPHFCARTLGELFRLIIDWDIAYHLFNNKENIAIICHKIMSGIDMPLEIYNEIYNQIPPSTVARYISGDPSPLDLGERPKTPEIVIKWFKEKYMELRHTVDDSKHNVSNFNDSHYCKKDVFNF